MGLLDSLFGGGTIKQTYQPSAPELELYNLLKPYLRFETGLGEAQTALAPRLRGLLNQSRQQLAPLGSAQQFQGGLETKLGLQDLVNQYALSRQQQAQSTLAGLVSGKGTQITQQPMNFAGLGQLIGMLLSGGIKLPSFGSDSFFGTGQNSNMGLNYTKPTYPY